MELQALDLARIAGPHEVALDDALMQAVPEGSATRRYRPESHAYYYAKIMEGLSGVGEVEGIWHTLMREGSVYCGMATLYHPNPVMGPVVCWRFSHDRRFAPEIFVGIGVRELNTVTLSHSISLGARHTHFTEEVPEEVRLMKREIWFAFEKQLTLMKRLQRVDMSRDRAMLQIVEMMRNDIVPVRRIGHVIEDWHAVPYGGPDDLMFKPTAWTLYNLVSYYYGAEATRGTVVSLLERSPKLYEWALRNWSKGRQINSSPLAHEM